jgi:hypothetical protein
VTRIAVSGHRGLPAPTELLVEAALRTHLGAFRQDLIGLSCIADGADQIFARVVLDLGGSLEVVVPARQYRAALPAWSHEAYDELIARASKVHQCDAEESTSEAHQAASEAMVDQSDRLVAVWDGRPARAFGGTADVVDYARRRGLPVDVIWPHGASRD